MLDDITAILVAYEKSADYRYIESLTFSNFSTSGILHDTTRKLCISIHPISPFLFYICFIPKTRAL